MLNGVMFKYLNEGSAGLLCRVASDEAAECGDSVSPSEFEETSACEVVSDRRKDDEDCESWLDVGGGGSYPSREADGLALVGFPTWFVLSS